MASATGLEPATYGLGNRRSILVSYADNLKAHDWKSCVPPKGTEGSNPSLSAIISKPRLVRGLLIMMRGVGFEP